jgi:hypothetical protein
MSGLHLKEFYKLILYIFYTGVAKMGGPKQSPLTSTSTSFLPLFEPMESLEILAHLFDVDPL